MSKRKRAPAPADGGMLQWLLGETCTVAEFFDQYWEKKPLVVRRGAAGKGFYKGLFSRAQMLEIISGSGRPFVYGQDLRVCRYVDGQREDTHAGAADAGAVAAAMDDQASTVQFFQPQRYSDELWKLNAALENSFGNLVGASAYLTPPGSQGP